MGLPVLVLGESGTGKSTSLRNFKPEDLKVINVANKPLPFKNKFESVSTDNYSKIIGELKLNKKKVVVIDDAQYLMANEFMRRATERGFDKFTEIAQNFWSLVNSVKDLPDDVIVYFLAHIERDANGNEKIKTIGKLLDEKITVEGMFTIVLKTNVTDGVYSFFTQNNGHDTVKSPLGMFPTYAIDNDLKYVDEKIRNYYEFEDAKSDAEIGVPSRMNKGSVSALMELIPRIWKLAGALGSPEFCNTVKPVAFPCRAWSKLATGAFSRTSPLTTDTEPVMVPFLRVP